MPLSLDFAFEGFRIIREKPKLVAFWGLALLISGGLMQLLMVAIAGPDLDRLQAILQPPFDPKAFVSLMQRASPAFTAAMAVTLPIQLVTNAVLSCAVFRAVWNGKDDRFGYLRFGADELRQIAVSVLLMLIVAGLFFGLVIAAGAIADGFGNNAQAAVVVLAMLLLGLVSIVFVLLRLSLCAVQSFDRRAVDIFGSWKLTAKHGWTLFGGYLVTAVMMVFVYILCVGIFWALVMVSNGGQISAADQRPDMTSLAAYLKPTVIAGIIFMNLLVVPLITALRMGALAAAYRTLAGQTPDAGV